MHVLVLDTVHGGDEIGAAFAKAGCKVDAVDVYHGTTPDLFSAAGHRSYDLIAAPVHLDPDHPLLARHRATPLITHHEAVRLLLADRIPHPMIEVTGARGKTTTAYALAHLLPGRGILHTSAGTFAWPDRDLLSKKSITPASVLAAAGAAAQLPGWLVAEVSLGVTGAGDPAIITSPETYPFGAGKKDALFEKAASARHAKRVLVADGVPCRQENVFCLGEIARCEGPRCRVSLDGTESTFENPLLLLPPDRTPLMLAAAAALLLGVSPAPLSTFSALPGRMAVSRENGHLIVDNANSGTNAGTTICAARYARHLAPDEPLTLVIGQPDGAGAVCEGFSPDQIQYAIDQVRPDRVVRVGSRSAHGTAGAACATFEEGKAAALRIAADGSIVLSVKTWR